MKTAARLYNPPEYVPGLVESEEHVHLGVHIVLAVGEVGPRPDRHHAPLLELLTLCRHRTLRKPGYIHLEDNILPHSSPLSHLLAMSPISSAPSFFLSPPLTAVITLMNTKVKKLALLWREAWLCLPCLKEKMSKSEKKKR